MYGTSGVIEMPPPASRPASPAIQQRGPGGPLSRALGPALLRLLPTRLVNDEQFLFLPKQMVRNSRVLLIRGRLVFEETIRLSRLQAKVPLPK